MEALLGQLAHSVTRSTDLEGLTRPLLELLESVTGLESTYLTMIDEKRGLQHILFARNSHQMRIPEGLSVPWDDTLCKRALLEDRSYTSDVAGCWGDSDAARALGIQTYLSQPVRMLDGGLYGTLCAASAARTEVASDTLKVLGLFARLIAHQIERERTLASLRKTNEELVNHALTDPLTGVPNRRALIRELKAAIERSRRDRVPLQVAFIDLDDFKTINDRYGHDIGDGFLVYIADRLATRVRSCDFVARYGGDEFVVVARNSSVEDFRRRLEQLTIGRYVRNDVVIDYHGASVGVAAATAEDCDAESLLSRADAAMYATKRIRREQRLSA